MARSSHGASVTYEEPVAALARALADQLRREKQLTKEAELRASAARSGEVKAKSELAKQRAGWKQRKKKWLAYKVKHEALKLKYSRIKSIVHKEQAARAKCPVSSPSVPVAAAPLSEVGQLPRGKNGGSTPPSQPPRKVSSRKPAAAKVPAADPLLKVAAAALSSLKVADSLKPSFPRPEAAERAIGLPPIATSEAVTNLGRGERRTRSFPSSSSVVDPKQPPVFHEVVRNKAARAKMDAVTCAQCSGFFDAAGGVLSPDTAQRCHHDHSRHRIASKVTRQPETPESFWQIGFDDTDQQRGAKVPAPLSLPRSS